MSLAAGQRTVPSDFLVHSCHCYFLLAGAGDQAILFHVEKVRDGRSFATRTVQARQRGRNIFTVTMSFVREGSGGGPGNTVEHAVAMPTAEDGSPLQPPSDMDNAPEYLQTDPFEKHRIQITNATGARAEDKKVRQWVRARGRISAEGGHQAHLNALAYVSDSYFIGTVTRVHRLWRWPVPPEKFEELPAESQEFISAANDWEGVGTDVRQWLGRPTVGMMVSLDHTIYFHQPKRLRADEWMLLEMETPWTGDGRGLVKQCIFAKDGTLLATCVQEVSRQPVAFFTALC
jgi:acyl-CoA thioesterase 8